MLNYLIEYTDTFSSKNTINNIIKENKFNDIPISEYDLEENSIDSVIEDLDTYSLFSNKKVIIVKNIDLLDIDSKDTKHIIKYLNNPNNDNLLIMLSNKLDTRKKIIKELKNNTKYIKIENDPQSIIKDLLKDYSLDPGVVNLIIEYTNSDIDAIKNECDKLIEYKYEEKAITKDDVKCLCIKKLGDSTNLTFDLVRYISSKNKKDSLITYNKLKNYNVDDMALIGLLESQLRLLEQVSILYDMGKRKNEIADVLGAHPYRIEKTLELLSFVSKKDIDKLILMLADIDYNFKSGKDLSKNPLEMFLINI